MDYIEPIVFAVLLILFNEIVKWATDLWHRRATEEFYQYYKARNAKWEPKRSKLKLVKGK